MALSAPLAVAGQPGDQQDLRRQLNGNSVTVIDGATNAVTDVAVGSAPDGLAINTVTNKIYVANSGSNTVTSSTGPPTPSPP